MKAITKAISILFVITILLCSIMTFSVSAAKATLHVSKSELSIGENVEVRVTYSDAQPVYTIDIVLNYDSSLFTYVSCTASAENTGSSIHIVDENCVGDYKIVFKSIAAGTYKFISTSYGVNFDYQKVPGAPQGGTVTIKAPTTSTPPVSSETSAPAVSNNANLKSLSVEGVTLSPAFSRNTTGYTATVANTVESVKVTAAAADRGAKVEGTGTYPLSEGTNKISITVLAADGTTKKEYAISIKRNTAAEDAAVPTPENPYSVTIDNANYTIVSDIAALAVPSGFTQAVIPYNGIEIPALTEPSGTVTLCWITKDGAEAPELFRYSEKDGFKKITYADIGGKFYIFEKFPAEVLAPSGFYETVLPLETGKIEVFAYNNSKLADIYVVYCWREGEYGYYRYDKRENTIQRAPDFTPVTEAVAQPEKENNKFTEWYLSRPNVAKAAIYIAFFGVCALIALAVLVIILIVKFPRRPKIPMIIDELPENEDIEGFSFDEK